jgi:hypothetical protein
VSAHDALAAFAADLVEEIAAGRALELAASMGTREAGAKQQPRPPSQFLRGAAAVHPQLGGHLVRMPGDTISCHAYKHLGGVQPPPSA